MRGADALTRGEMGAKTVKRSGVTTLLLLIACAPTERAAPATVPPPNNVAPTTAPPIAYIPPPPTPQASAPSQPPETAPNSGLAPEQLEALVSPVALYPDPLLVQILNAATRPQEVVEAAKWTQAHPGLSGKDLDGAIQGQRWEASVKALASFPDMLKMMSEHPDWTRDLGEAYRGNGEAVLFAVQQLRARALAAGNLKSTTEQTVKTEPVSEGSGDGGQSPAMTIIRIEPANPQVIYVPVYNPTVVYGTWAYPGYPPPPIYPPGYVAGATVVSFSIGFAIGSAAWRYPPYPAYPRYPPYRPPSGRPPGFYPPPGGRPAAPSQPPGGRPPGVSPAPPAARPMPAPGRPAGQPQQRPASPGVTPLPSQGARSPSQMPAGGVASGGDRGRPAATPSTAQRRSGGSSGGSAFGGMDKGSQTKAASARGNASVGGRGAGRKR